MNDPERFNDKWYWLQLMYNLKSKWGWLMTYQGHIEHNRHSLKIWDKNPMLVGISNLTQSGSKTIITRSRCMISLIVFTDPCYKHTSYFLTTHSLICSVNCYVTICMSRIYHMKNCTNLIMYLYLILYFVWSFNINLACVKVQANSIHFLYVLYL